MPFRKLQRNFKESREHVHVFVPVEVRWRDPCSADFLNLRLPLGFHFRQWEAAPRAPQKQALGGARELAGAIQKTGDNLPIGYRWAAREVQMDADTQSRRGPRGFYSSGKRCAIGQQRSAGHNPVVKRLEDAAVHPFGPSQVIGIDDEILHGLSCTGIPTCP